MGFFPLALKLICSEEVLLNLAPSFILIAKRYRSWRNKDPAPSGYVRAKPASRVPVESESAMVLIRVTLAMDTAIPVAIVSIDVSGTLPRRKTCLPMCL